MPEDVSRAYKFTKTNPCKHVHVSGRKCGQRVPKKDLLGKKVLFCELHKGECSECRSMMRAFGIKYLEDQVDGPPRIHR